MKCRKILIAAALCAAMACTALAGCGGETTPIAPGNTDPASSQEETTPAVPTAAELAGTYQWYEMEYQGKVYTTEQIVQEMTKDTNPFGLDHIAEGDVQTALAQANADSIILYEDGTGEIRLQFLTDGISICTWEMEDDNLVLWNLGGTSAIYAPMEDNVITLNLSDMVLKFKK